MVDYFTKRAEAIPLAQADAPSVAQAIVTQWIATHGVPLQLHSDQGPSSKVGSWPTIAVFWAFVRQEQRPTIPKGTARQREQFEQSKVC